MKLTLSHLLSFVLSQIFLITQISWAEEKVNPYGKYLVNQEGLVSIEMATFNEKNEAGLRDAILVISGFAAYEEGIDGQAIRYSAVPSGVGFDLRAQKGSKEVTRLTSREKWGSWSQLTVYLAGRSYMVSEKSEKSKEVRPKHLFTAMKNDDGPSQKEHPVNPYGRAYKASAGGVAVEMAVFREKNSYGLQDVLLKVSGAAAYDAGIDGKVIKYQAVPSGTGWNFQYSEDGKTKNRMIVREAGWNHVMEIYLDGQDHKLEVDSQGAKSVRPLHLHTAYKKSQD